MTKVGVAGYGAIGAAVCKALLNGIGDYTLEAVSDIREDIDCPADCVDFETLLNRCDLLIECLPPAVAHDFAKLCIENGKDLILITSSTLLLHPELIEAQSDSSGRIIVPSGALIGMDGLNALKNIGIQEARIITTKPPKGFSGAPYVEMNRINLDEVTAPQQIFSGNALEASKGFPANVNVSATLSLAGIGPEKTQVEIWADPNTRSNSHEIIVKSQFSTMQAKVQNMPDPANPKSSVLAAQSIIAVLRGFSDPLVVL